MPNQLRIALVNDSDSSNLHAYVTGIAIQQGGERCLLKADGHSLYFPGAVDAVGTPPKEDCAIPLGKPGNTVVVTIPQIAGGRIWIADGHLTFVLNPAGNAAALVEPSVLNPADPNAKVNFAFAEFTLNDAQLYANISYVDFVPRLPVALTLKEGNGHEQHVAGMAPDGIDKMAHAMQEQAQRDGKPWGKLVVPGEHGPLRILNATHGDAVGASFDGYFEPYVKKVWEKYSSSELHINTQAAPGIVSGKVNSGKLQFQGEAFDAPSTADILGCNSGPFTTGSSAVRNAIIPRLAAAFVRSTLLVTDNQPSAPNTFYTVAPTNYYAAFVHQFNKDHKGYAFAYDDVQPDGGEDQSGKVNGGDPKLFVVTVGGEGKAVVRVD